MTFEERNKYTEEEMTRLKADLQCARELQGDALRGLVEFKLHGEMPGGFLRACLENDFVRACTQADTTNRKNLVNIALLLYNGMPRGCWGSPEKVEAWEGFAPNG